MIRTTIAAMLALVFISSSAQAETLKALTAKDLSPFSRGADEPLPGFAHEYMLAVATAAGYTLDIEYLPWKRAQDTAQKTSGVLIFGVTRSKAREPLYDWVTNLVTVERVFLTTGAPVNTYEQAHGLGMIGARGSYLRTLVANGFSNLEEASADSNFKKLKAGRLDAVFTQSARAIFIWTQELGFDRDTLTVSEGFGRSDIWLAASKGYPADVVAKLNAANARLREDGTFEALYEKYFGALPLLEVANPELRPTGLDG